MLIPRKNLILTQELAEELFNTCNRVYFNNRLKKIPITLIDDVENNGTFKFDIDFDSNTYVNLRIEMSAGHRRSFNMYKNTMIHELAHYKVLFDLSENKKLESVKYYRDGQMDKFEKIVLIGKYAHTGKWKKLIQKINNTYGLTINIPEN